MRFQDQVVIVTGAARGLGHRTPSASRTRAPASCSPICATTSTPPPLSSPRRVPRRSPCRSTSTTPTPRRRWRARRSRPSVASTCSSTTPGSGATTKSRPLLQIDPAYWDLVMGVNVRGPLLCSRAVAPTMVSQGRGRIINISSIGAYMVSGVYGVSKLALNQLTFALAKELGTAGVTVNAVAPGPIDNEASRRQVPQAGMDRAPRHDLAQAAR